VLIGTHYRSKLNFSMAALETARQTLTKFDALFARLKQAPAGDALKEKARSAAIEASEKFMEAVCDDLNISEAFSAVFVLSKAAGKLLAQGLGADGAKIILEQFRRCDIVLGALDVDAVHEAPKSDAPAQVLELIAARTAAKKAKDFAKADAIRDELKQLGWGVVDKPMGPEPVRL